MLCFSVGSASKQAGTLRSQSRDCFKMAAIPGYSCRCCATVSVTCNYTSTDCTNCTDACHCQMQWTHSCQSTGCV